MHSPAGYVKLPRINSQKNKSYEQQEKKPKSEGYGKKSKQIKASWEEKFKSSYKINSY